MLIHLPTKWVEKAEAEAHLDSITPAEPRFPRLPPARPGCLCSPSTSVIHREQKQRAWTPLEIRLLERKHYYKERITQKTKGKVMGRDRNKTNQDLKNKSVLNRHKKKTLGNQPYFCVTAEPSIGNIVSLVFKQILKKERTGIFTAEWRHFLNYCFSILFISSPLILAAVVG